MESRTRRFCSIRKARSAAVSTCSNWRTMRRPMMRSLGAIGKRLRATDEGRSHACARACAHMSLPTLATSACKPARAASQFRRSGGSRGLGRTYFFLDEPLLLELDLLALVLALELDFFDALELPDLVGMALSFRRAQPPAEITVPTRGLSSL